MIGTGELGQGSFQGTGLLPPAGIIFPPLPPAGSKGLPLSGLPGEFGLPPDGASRSQKRLEPSLPDDEFDAVVVVVSEANPTSLNFLTILA